MRKIWLASVSLCLLGYCATDTARAAQKDFQYGYIRMYATCTPDFGSPEKYRVVSNIVTYCPYDPNPPDFYTDATHDLNLVCLGKVTHSGMFDKAFSSESAAANARDNFCNGDKNASCKTISVGGYYSKYNNPANCKP
jgi:hypothetical protein